MAKVFSLILNVLFCSEKTIFIWFVHYFALKYDHFYSDHFTLNFMYKLFLFISCPMFSFLFRFLDLKRLPLFIVKCDRNGQNAPLNCFLIWMAIKWTNKRQSMIDGGSRNWFQKTRPDLTNKITLQLWWSNKKKNTYDKNDPLLSNFIIH